MANSRRRSKRGSNKETRDKRRSNAKTERVDRDDVKSSTNDPQWYAADPAILRDAASIPFSWPYGTKIGYPPVVSKMSDVVPGVMALRVYPTLGKSENAYSPLNVAATSMYSYIRHANSGHSNYDAPDLMLFVTAMAQIYSAINWAQRLYALAMLYDQKNRYMPKALIKANGVDPDSLINNLSNFRYWLNTVINKAASLAVPATLSIFSRMSFLYQNIYCDGPTTKSQMYELVPNGFFKFKLNTDSSGMLEYVDLPSRNMSWTDVRDYIESMVQAVWEQEDFGIMSGDILKAYGDNIIKLISVPEYTPIFPIYDQMVLTQFKNATVALCKPNDITQDSTHAFLKSGVEVDDSQPTWRQLVTSNVLDLDHLITIDAADPTPEMVIEMTRLTFGYQDTDTEETMDTGSEFVNEVAVYQIMDGAIVERVIYQGLGAAYPSEVITDTLYEGLILTSIMMREFKYAPCFWMCYFTSGASTEIKQMYRVWDVDNYAVLSAQDLAKLHETAMLNMLHVPSIGKVLN